MKAPCHVCKRDRQGAYWKCTGRGLSGDIMFLCQDCRAAAGKVGVAVQRVNTRTAARILAGGAS